MNDQIRVWKLDDCEYIAAYTLEDALEFYESLTGFKPSDMGDPWQVEEISITGEVNAADEDEPPRILTFEQYIQEQMAKGDKVPMYVGCDPHYA